MYCFPKGKPSTLTGVLREIHGVPAPQQKRKNPKSWVGLSSKAAKLTWAMLLPSMRKSKMFPLMGFIVPWEEEGQEKDNA